MSNFEDLKKSLEEAIAYKQGKLKNVKTHKWEVIPLPEFDATTIKAIRLNAQMTQAIFAACIGVTKKAVEAWESGRTRPDGAARRTLGLMQKSSSYATDNGILLCHDDA